MDCFAKQKAAKNTDDLSRDFCPGALYNKVVVTFTGVQQNFAY